MSSLWWIFAGLLVAIFEVEYRVAHVVKLLNLQGKLLEQLTQEVQELQKSVRDVERVISSQSDDEMGENDDD